MTWREYAGWILLIVAVVAMEAIIFLAMSGSKPTPIPLSGQPAITSTVANNVEIATRHPLSSHPLSSVDALRGLLASDPALAQFYHTEGFDASCATAQTLEHPIWAFNSYRLNGKIHFTAKPVLIPEGTKVFIDCNGVIAKADCANILLTSRLPLPTDPQQDSGIVPPTPDTLQIYGIPTPSTTETQLPSVITTVTTSQPPIVTPPDEPIIPPPAPSTPTPELPTGRLAMLGIPMAFAIRKVRM